MKKVLVIGTGVGISIAFLMVLVMDMENVEFGKEYGKINMNHDISPCETLTNQMIQARNNVRQYVLNPNQFSSKESEKITREFQEELNRITKEFSKQDCDKNMEKWITPEISQRVIDQSGG
jgi:hypothetical protein